MDADSERRVFALLKKLRPHMAVLFVTHRLHTLPRICDEICVLESGGGTFSGSHAELLLTENVYSRFWGEWLVEEI